MLKLEDYQNIDKKRLAEDYAALTVATGLVPWNEHSVAADIRVIEDHFYTDAYRQIVLNCLPHVVIELLNEYKKPKQGEASNFQIFKMLADEGTEDGIAAFPDFVEARKVKRGAHVTFGVGPKGVEWLANNTHYFMLYAVKKSDFARIKTKLESK